MSTPAPQTAEPEHHHVHHHLPSLTEFGTSLLRTVVVALFLLTFLVQPFFIPSGSMENTLLVGDFLLFNKQVYAPPGALSRHFLPYRQVKRGDIIVFHHTRPAYLVKRVIGIPGDRLRIVNGKVIVNGQPLSEPYAIFKPTGPDSFHDNFPSTVYTDPEVDPTWWRQMQGLIRNGELIVPKGEYFVLGDNRNHSRDSRYWGFVKRQQIVASPLMIYFSLNEPSSADGKQASDDRLGHDGSFFRWLAGFVRWKRIFLVIH